MGKILIRERYLLCKRGYAINKSSFMSLICVIICLCLLCACSVFEQKTSRNFTMDGDILLSYNGEATVVDVPENVTKINGNVFSKSPNADKITTINLGANVNTIDFTSFSGLSALSSISISEKNSYYLCIDNFLLATDGSAIFCFGTSKPDIIYLINKLNDRKIDIPFYKDGYKIIFNDAVLSFTEDSIANKDAPTIEDGILVSMSAKGHTVNFKYSINYYGNHIWSIFEADDMIVFSDLANYSIGDTYVFTDNGLYEQHNSENEIYSDYNSPIVVFSLGDDGKLAYTCQPIKFVDSGSDEVYLQYCVGKDEIYLESGIVTFDNARPKYSAKTQTTVVQQFGEDKLKESYRLINSELSQDKVLFKTLEEYLENNAKKYIAFDPTILNSQKE